MALDYWFSKSGVNVAFHEGLDTESKVIQNRKDSLKNYHIDNLVYLNQIHSNIVLKGTSGGLIGNGDGIILDKKGIVGLIMTADCNPVLLYDKRNDVLAMLHAGRLGVESKIVFEGFKILSLEYGTRASDVFVYVGPSIRACCYEVRSDVFCGDSLSLGKIMRKDSMYLDLIKVLQAQFLELGFSDIVIDKNCTCCSREYFSYRRDKDCGRLGLFATIT